ncbi:MAG: hypothetical protein SNJ33_06235 [Rikenellaceae bacterium]
MNRIAIQDALYEAIVEHNFTPLLSPTVDTSTPIEKLPAVWCAPLKLLEKRGRNSGQIDYYLELALIYPSSDKSYEDKMVILGGMEDSILSILSSLSLNERVVLLDDISLEVATKSLTKFGDLSMQATANITTYFGN